MILNKLHKQDKNIKNKELCEAVNKIQKILQNGDYKIKKWINSNNEDALFLCHEDEPAWKGVFIQKIN